MSEQIREQISAFLDGELPDSETELLLKRLSRDSALRDTFGRYALIAEVVRTPDGGPLSRSFVDSINHRIDSEAAPAPMAATVAQARRWWRPLAGAAVAAGVAAVAVVTLEHRADLPLRAAGTPQAVSSAVAVAPTSQPASGQPAVRLLASSAPLKPREDVSYTVPAIPADNNAALPAARLTNYVFAHSKYSSPLGQRNVLSGLVADQPDGALLEVLPADSPPDVPAPSSVLSAQP